MVKITDDMRAERIRKILKIIQTFDGKNKSKVFEKYSGDGNEKLFQVTGDVAYENKLAISCGMFAKVFCYCNSVMEPIDQKLEVQVMMSLHPESLIDGMRGHTLPCVKMGEGKNARWYAIEPNPNIVKNCPKHEKYPDIPFIMDEIKVGNTIHHILKGMIPYEIIKTVPWETHNKMSFGKFLKTVSKRNKLTKMSVGIIETILKQINKGEQPGRIYDFCKCLDNRSLPIMVISAQNAKHCFYALVIKIDGDLYYFMPNHTYLMLHKFKKLENGNYLDIANNEEYTIKEKCTPKKYVQLFEDSMREKSARGK